MFYARGAEILISAQSVQNLQQLRNKCKLLLICTTSIKNKCFKRVLVRDNEANNNNQQTINDNKQHAPFFSLSGGHTNGNYREYYRNDRYYYISCSRYYFSVFSCSTSVLKTVSYYTQYMSLKHAFFTRSADKQYFAPVPLLCYYVSFAHVVGLLNCTWNYCTLTKITILMLLLLLLL